MLSKKYKNDFIKDNGILGELGFIVNAIIEYEVKCKKNLLDWNDENISGFLKEFKSISEVSLNKYFTALKRFIEYICDKENLPIKSINTENIDFEQLIDVESLLNVTLSYNQYRQIKNQLSKDNGMEEMNVRDKLLFELAWVGLTSEEIKMLEEDKIKFSKNDYDEDIVILFLNTDRIVRIEDSEIVEDIKKCMKEKYYVVTTKNSVYKKMSYRDSSYLIKPVNVGKGKKEDYIENPGVTLVKIFKSNHIKCEGIDMDSLTLEDIRRSKIVYLLAPDNREYFNDETVLGLFNLKKKQGLEWLKKISSIKYGK